MDQNNLGRANNFSLLRILFATLVILSHSFELIDGNRSHEILTRMFGTISFGELAVDGFFIVSGYLITKSLFYSDYRSYLIKRCLRIYPGFIVAFIFSVLCCWGFSLNAVQFSLTDIVHNGLNILFLLPPGIKDAYQGLFYATPNGAMWTISYEFHCYLLILFLGFFGALNKEKLVVLLTACLLIVYLIHPETYHPFALQTVSVPNIQPTDAASRLWEFIKSISIEGPLDDIRLFGIFLAGSCFFLLRENITYTNRGALLAAILLAFCMFSKHLAQPALAVFGSYLIFWFAMYVRPFAVSRTFNDTDLSYGIYLYAWPIQEALISQIQGITPWELIVTTLSLATILAFLSWTFIEKPFLNLKSSFIRTSKPTHPLTQSV